MAGRSVAQIVTEWHQRIRVRYGETRVRMGEQLNGIEYPEGVFFEKFRRDPPRVSNYELDELLALIRVFCEHPTATVKAAEAIELFDSAGMKITAFSALKNLFPADEFDDAWTVFLRTHNLYVKRAGSTRHFQSQLPSERFIVGRDQDVAQFEQFLAQKSEGWIYQIYGPGGVGKSVVADKFHDFVRHQGHPIAYLNGNAQNYTPTQFLGLIADGFTYTDTLADFFSEFGDAYLRYNIVQTLMNELGGIESMFDVIGNVIQSVQMNETIDRYTRRTSRLKLDELLGNRFTLEGYLRNAEATLTHELAEAIATSHEASVSPLTILIDTYEELEGLDDWLCNKLIPTIRGQVRLAILGRTELTRVNFDWTEFGHQLIQRELSSLSERDTQLYLQHYGLSDTTAVKHVYEYTRGYPLLLVLVQNLARQVGGWDKLGSLEARGDRLHIAGKLLERILREERVQEVRAFLEKGVVVEWFNPEIISVVLDVSWEDGRRIFDKIGRHSFVERHPEGLKFHDVIRAILKDRLSPDELNTTRERVRQYFLEQSGRTM